MEVRVVKKLTDEMRHLILSHSQNHQTVPGMTQPPFIEAEIAREQCRTTQRQQKGNDFLVRHPLASQFLADLPNGNTPTPQ